MDDIRLELSGIDENMILFDGLDEAVIGYIHNDDYLPIVIYDFNKCVELFMVNDGMTEEEALEWMDYNVLGTYCGAYTPKFLYRLE